MPTRETEDDHLLPLGYRLEEFEIVRVLGEGGFGVAYLVLDHSLKQQRVLKEFLPNQVARRERSGLRITARTGEENHGIYQEGLRSFISEARLLASLDHPNVVRVYRCLEANGTAYLVMHYYHGQTLKQRIQALNGARPHADWLIRLLMNLLDGLQAVHDHGILHRDIKPDNIYLVADDRPVLIDFGAARRVVGGRTKAMTRVITEGYSPIEQYVGDGIHEEGSWTDLYALGATLYWLISGNKPRNAVVRMIEDALPPAVTLGQDLYPATLLASIDRALAVRPEDRYRVASEWLAVLEALTVGIADALDRNDRPILEVVSPVSDRLTLVEAVPPAPLALKTAPLVAEPIPLAVEGEPLVSEPVMPTQTARVAASLNPRIQSSCGASTHLRVRIDAGGESDSLYRSSNLALFNKPKKYLIACGLLLVVVGMIGYGWRVEQKPLIVKVDPEVTPVPERCFQVGGSALELDWNGDERQSQLCVDAFVGRYEAPFGDWPALIPDKATIPEGCFQMVSSASKPEWKNDKRLPQVCVDAFVGRYEILFEHWQTVIPEMVLVPRGCFQAGSPTSEPERESDERQRQVCVESFEIGKYEVTQGQWQAVMSNNRARFKTGDDFPVEQVSWNDIQNYLKRLSQMTGRTYRLPTEAEWEYACRGGKAGERYCGGDNVGRVAWYAENSDGQTQPVGRKAANGFGLYDMSGNVWEWTCSLYRDSHNGAEGRCLSKDAKGPRSVRGGSWANTRAGVRAAYRFRLPPTYRKDILGFRIARSP